MHASRDNKLSDTRRLCWVSYGQLKYIISFTDDDWYRKDTLQSELFGQPNNLKNHIKGNFPDKTVFQFISDLQWKTKSHYGPCAGERISHEDKLKGS